jgi:hypothetical protein
METWIAWFQKMGQGLRGVDLSHDYRIIALGPLSDSRKSYGKQLIELSQEEILAFWSLQGDAFVTLETDTCPALVERELITALEQRLDGFSPSHIVLLNQQQWLRRHFKDATFINVELAWMSRTPFPQFWHLDICGAGTGRIVAAHEATMNLNYRCVNVTSTLMLKISLKK